MSDIRKIDRVLGKSCNSDLEHLYSAVVIYIFVGSDTGSRTSGTVN
jgi:hypothetical protein